MGASKTCHQFAIKTTDLVEGDEVQAIRISTKVVLLMARYRENARTGANILWRSPSLPALELSEHEPPNPA